MRTDRQKDRRGRGHRTRSGRRGDAGHCPNGQGPILLVSVGGNGGSPSNGTGGAGGHAAASSINGGNRGLFSVGGAGGGGGVTGSGDGSNGGEGAPDPAGSTAAHDVAREGRTGEPVTIAFRIAA
jgi:hypothetical protein